MNILMGIWRVIWVVCSVRTDRGMKGLLFWLVAAAACLLAERSIFREFCLPGREGGQYIGLGCVQQEVLGWMHRRSDAYSVSGVLSFPGGHVIRICRSCCCNFLRLRTVLKRLW
eukprot:430311-Pelagomonas_calceolata.AAC.1